MRLILSSLLLCALVAAGTVGQMAKPAAELARFDPLIGNWQGSGTAPMGGQDSKWTAVASVTRILGGHFIQEDIKIDLDGMPAPLVFRTVYSWDAPTKRYAYFNLGNNGEVDRGNVYWTADGKLVGSNLTTQEGAPVAHRWVYAFPKKDSYDFRIDSAQGGGEFAVMVTGTYQKGTATFSAADGAVGSFMAAPAPEMAKMKGQIGKWAMKGSFSMNPGDPMMAFSGSENISPILGGHANMSESKGDSVEGMPTWEGHFYTAWDPASRCYRNFSVDNFGGSMTEEMHALSDNRLVTIAATVHNGVPQVMRGVIDIDKDGNKATVVVHRSGADKPPEKAFEGNMTRVAGSEGERPAAERK